MKSLLAERQVPLAITMIPAEFQILKGKRLSQHIFLPLSDKDKSRPHIDFANVLSALDIPYIDLLPEFAKNSRTSLYLTGDDHLNPNGHKLAAEIIARALTPLVAQDTSGLNH